MVSNFNKSFLNDQQQFVPNTFIERTYKKGSYIYTPDEIASDIFIVKKGIIKIIYPDLKNNNPTNQITKSLIISGNIFGEMVLLGEPVRRDYAYVLEDTELQIYTKENFQMLLESRPYLYHLVMQQLGKKLLNIENRFADMILKNSQTRVIEYLLKLAQDKGVKVGFDTLITNFLSQQEIANYTVTARQTVSTVLNKLRAKKIIHYTRKRLMIRDISLLEQELFNSRNGYSITAKK